MLRIVSTTRRKLLLQSFALILGAVVACPGLFAEDSAKQQETSRNGLDLNALSSLGSSQMGDHHGGGGLLSGWTVAGFIDTAFTYNFDNPRSRENRLRIFDTRHSSFDLHAVRIELAKGATAEMPVGAEFIVTAGQDAAGIHSTGLSDGDIDITSANIQVLIPGEIPGISGGTLKIGKFETTIGGEVINSAANPNYSRSILFGKAIPFTHTGILFSNEAADGLVSYNAGIVNGWDNTADNNNSKSLMAGFGLAPCEEFSFALNGIIGPEEDDDESSYKAVLDFTATAKIPDAGLEISLNADIGTNSGNSTIDPNGDTDSTAMTGMGDDFTILSSKWYGFAAIANFNLATLGTGCLDNCFVALRGEVFWDPDGTQVGLSTGSGLAQRYSEVTLTFGWRPYSNLLTRLEFRHDVADAQVFDEGSGNMSNHQNTIAVNTVLSF